ncbi:hypothetical protein, partial [Vibrio vulnificus]|uniref:hypothetical protein n=1 Tax=Vibrio vulnificus TaxID=672 RepID=UPI001ED994DC
PSNIQPRKLLLTPKLNPVPSVLILSSTNASAGPVAPIILVATIAAIDLLIFLFVAGFPSDEHRIAPPRARICDNPMMGEVKAAAKALRRTTE